MTPEERLVQSLEDFDYPKRAALADEADMVMKGGITSGVVYPLAVCELAKTRRFRNVGGSSAGGIAAAMAAAAEIGRDGGGFTELAKLPMELGDDLCEMFQASRRTRPLLRMLLAGMDKERGKAGRVLRSLGGVIGAAPVAFTLTLVTSLLLAFWGLLAAAGAPQELSDWRAIAVGLAFAALPALVLAVVAAVAGALRSAKSRLESNGYGVCLGSAGARWPANASSGKVEPFTDWLHVRINRAAKVADERSHVLTFAELWDAPAGTDKCPRSPLVRLEMMTTNVTFCRPVRLPFEENVYSYCPKELAEYFPPPVMNHLSQHVRPKSRPTSADWTCPDHPDQVLVRLPVAGDLPVIIAVRLTLSFPGLISAVPLFAVDRGPESEEVVRCWFSDGGISSNFPIHFFDSLWPVRPTFGISLGPYPAGRPRTDVYLRDPRRTAATRVRDSGTLTGFVTALLDTLQNWSDEGQVALPGFRDRIVQVHHTDDEGGMNLNMPRETILALCARGHAAAVALKKFDFANHRERRYSTAMGQLDRTARQMLASYDEDLPGGEPGYREFVEEVGPPSAVARTDRLLTFVGREVGPDPEPKPAPPPDFTRDDLEPRPLPDLRIVAHF